MIKEIILIFKEKEQGILSYNLKLDVGLLDHMYKWLQHEAERTKEIGLVFKVEDEKPISHNVNLDSKGEQILYNWIDWAMKQTRREL